MRREGAGPRNRPASRPGRCRRSRDNRKRFRYMLMLLIDNAAESLRRPSGTVTVRTYRGARRPDRGRGEGRRDRYLPRGPGTRDRSVLHDQAGTSGYRPDDRPRHLAAASRIHAHRERAGPGHRGSLRCRASPGRLPAGRSAAGLGLSPGSDGSRLFPAGVRGSGLGGHGAAVPGDAGETRGKLTSTVVPAPGMESSTIWPPSCSVSSRQMASPRPLPSILECSSRARRKNGSKTLLARFGGMPGPSSITATHQCVVAGPGTRPGHVPPRGCT